MQTMPDCQQEPTSLWRKPECRSLGRTFRLSSLLAKFVGSHLLGLELLEVLALLKRGLPKPTMPAPVPLLVVLEKPPEELEGPLL